MADMMAKEPSQRISSAREVQARLAPFVSSAPAASSRPTTVVRPPPRIVAHLPADEADSSSSQEMRIPVREGAKTVYWPLVVFVLTPLALAGGVLLLRWLAKTLLQQ
jgi:hypothetical protein